MWGIDRKCDLFLCLALNILLDTHGECSGNLIEKHIFSLWWNQWHINTHLTFNRVIYLEYCYLDPCPLTDAEAPGHDSLMGRITYVNSVLHVYLCVSLLSISHTSGTERWSVSLMVNKQNGEGPVGAQDRFPSRILLYHSSIQYILYIYI